MPRSRYTVTYTIESPRDDELATWWIADKLAMWRIAQLLRGSGLIAVGGRR
jgi:hypothetical protein